MKKYCIVFLAAVCLFCLAGCGKTGGTDSFDYQKAAEGFPDFKAINPARFLNNDSPMGPSDGWQDFGSGEIRTYPMPRASATYQFYAWYIRNDLNSLYGEVKLPDKLKDLPKYLEKTTVNGSRLLWYSMGQQLPTAIKLQNTTEIKAENGSQSFLQAQYKVTLDGKETTWFLYLMEENGVYSSFGVRSSGEMNDMVKKNTEGIVKSWKKK